jgi:hypothetical protein
MIQNQVWNDLMQFNQAAVENAFTAITMLQEQTERMVNLYLDQATLLPKEGKKVYNEYLKAWSKGSETFKKAVDAGFQQMEGLLA